MKSGSAVPAPPKHHRGMQAVALWSLAKGLLVAGVGLGFALLVARGESARDMAQWLTGHLHMDANGRLASAFLAWSDRVSLEGWLVFFAVVAAYAIIQTLQAWGLWREKRWAEWLTALSGGIYLPPELWQLVRQPSWACLILLTVNASIVAYMAWMLWRGRRRQDQGFGAT